MTDMTIGTATPASTRPYPPSWVDRLTAWFDRQPGPNWSYYVGIWAVLIGIDLYLRAQQTGAFTLPRPFVWVFMIAFPYNIGLIDYLDKAAGKALQRFRPGLNCDETSFDTMCYHLTTMRSRSVLIALLIGAVLGVITVASVPTEQQLAFIDIDSVGPVYYFHALMALVAFISAATTVYHTWHQLRVVSHIYRRRTLVNLFEQQPLYAFSTLSAQTAVGILFISYSWTLAAPEIFSIPITSFWLPVFNIICALTFVFPLLGIHNLLRADKEARLTETGKRLRAASAELHRRVDAGAMTDMDNLNKVMQALELELQAIRRTPTWPWHPEAPRAVAAALFFPVMVWLIQWLLSRMIVP